MSKRRYVLGRICEYRAKCLMRRKLKILALNESVSTTGDECNQVEWRKQPFEVRGPVQKGEEIVSPCRNTKE